MRKRADNLMDEKRKLLKLGRGDCEKVGEIC